MPMQAAIIGLHLFTVLIVTALQVQGREASGGARRRLDHRAG